MAGAGGGIARAVGGTGGAGGGLAEAGGGTPGAGGGLAGAGGGMAGTGGGMPIETTKRAARIEPKWRGTPSLNPPGSGGPKPARYAPGPRLEHHLRKAHVVSDPSPQPSPRQKPETPPPPREPTRTRARTPTQPPQGRRRADGRERFWDACQQERVGEGPNGKIGRHHTWRPHRPHWTPRKTPVGGTSNSARSGTVKPNEVQSGRASLKKEKGVHREKEAEKKVDRSDHGSGGEPESSTTGQGKGLAAECCFLFLSIGLGHLPDRKAPLATGPNQSPRLPTRRCNNRSTPNTRKTRTHGPTAPQGVKAPRPLGPHTRPTHHRPYLWEELDELPVPPRFPHEPRLLGGMKNTTAHSGVAPHPPHRSGRPTTAPTGLAPRTTSDTHPCTVRQYPYSQNTDRDDWGWKLGNVACGFIQAHIAARWLQGMPSPFLADLATMWGILDVGSRLTLSYHWLYRGVDPDTGHLRPDQEARLAEEWGNPEMAAKEATNSHVALQDIGLAIEGAAGAEN